MLSQNIFVLILKNVLLQFLVIGRNGGVSIVAEFNSAKRLRVSMEYGLSETNAHVFSLQDEFMVGWDKACTACHFGQGNGSDVSTADGNHTSVVLVGNQFHSMTTHTGGQYAVEGAGRTSALGVSKNGFAGIDACHFGNGGGDVFACTSWVGCG